MDDLRERLRVLDLVEPPELWSRIGVRPATLPPEPRFRRVVAIVMLLIALAIAVIVRLSYRDTASEPIRPGPKPNGRIYFAGAENGLYPGDASLYAVQPDGTGFRLVASAGKVSSLGSIAVSHDGKLVTYATGGFDMVGDIFVLRADGSNPVRLTNDPPGIGHWPGGHADYSPDWSPDGREIVFSSSRCCDSESGFSTFALYTIRPDGSGLHEITNGPRGASDPAWSPDGALIAYSARGEIGVIDTEGHHARRIAQADGFIRGLAWSPDGDEIAYATTVPGDSPAPWGSTPEDFRIHVVRLDGSGDHVVYRCGDVCRFGGYGVQWSPDGKEIAFTFGRVRGKGIVWHIGMIAPDGAGFRVLHTHGIQPRDLSWIPAD